MLGHAETARRRTMRIAETSESKLLEALLQTT